MDLYASVILEFCDVRQPFLVRSFCRKVSVQDISATAPFLFFMKSPGSDAVYKFPDQGKGCAQRSGVLPQYAQVYESAVFFKRVAGEHIPLQNREVRLQVFAQETSDDDITVQDHPDNVDAGRQVAQHIEPERLIFRDMLVHTGEKGFQRYAQIIGDAAGGAVSFQTSVPAAAAQKSALFHADMS